MSLDPGALKPLIQHFKVVVLTPDKATAESEGGITNPMTFSLSVTYFERAIEKNFEVIDEAVVSRRGSFSPEFVEPLQAFSQVDISKIKQAKLKVGRLADYEGDLFTVTFSGVEPFTFLWPSYDEKSGEINLDLDLTEIEDWSSFLGNYTVNILVTAHDDTQQIFDFIIELKGTMEEEPDSLMIP